MWIPSENFDQRMCPVSRQPDPALNWVQVGPSAANVYECAARAQIEAFIRGIYAERYGAQVTQFAPHLVALRDATGDIVAAAGYRPAAQGPLFLERYLAAPVETLLSHQLGGELQPLHLHQRQSIVEVGHLAASRAGQGRRLILLLGPHLAQQGFEWMVSTLTEKLRLLFMRLRLALLTLGTAHPMALGAEAVHWGRYYDHRPMVMAGHLHTLLRQVAPCQVLL